ncbi:MAG: hypothetical protein WAL22_23555 [Solirubrobacteraceae bacterium]
MQRRATMTLVAVAAAAMTAMAGIGAATAAAPKPAKTVKGSLITVQPNTLKPGTKLASSAVGFPRAFVNANTAWAFASTDQAQYAAITTNGGTTWRTASPALHVNAAQAPLSVTQLNARSPKVAYAFGSGQVADITSDGGKHWYRALFIGTASAVVPGLGPKQLLTFVDGGSSGSGPSGPVSQYASSNGGRTWTLSPGS